MAEDWPTVSKWRNGSFQNPTETCVLALKRVRSLLAFFNFEILIQKPKFLPLCFFSSLQTSIANDVQCYRVYQRVKE